MSTKKYHLFCGFSRDHKKCLVFFFHKDQYPKIEAQFRVKSLILARGMKVCVSWYVAILWPFLKTFRFIWQPRSSIFRHLPCIHFLNFSKNKFKKIEIFFLILFNFFKLFFEKFKKIMYERWRKINDRVGSSAFRTSNVRKTFFPKNKIKCFSCFYSFFQKIT